jgi:hypothetical protein
MISGIRRNLRWSSCYRKESERQKRRGGLPRIPSFADGAIESLWSLRDESGEFRPWMDARLNPAD